MKGAVARMMGSTVVSQALLSASSFFVATYLLRLIGPESYGYYVLVTTGILLFANLQGAFFLTPTLVILPASTSHERGVYLGGLFRLRHRATLSVALAIAAAGLGAWALGMIDARMLALVLVGTTAGLAAVFREFVRGVLLAQHLGVTVLHGDILYAVLLVAGSVASAFLPHPELMALAGLGLGALCSGLFLDWRLWRFEPWDRAHRQPVLNRLVHVGGWSAFGSMVHWSFSQGYTYVVAALVDVRAVAALAATRLLVMPLNLLSSGINQSMYPLVSRWNVSDGLRPTVRRVAKVGGVLLLLGALYVLVAWLARNLFFDQLLKRTFEGQDQLLLFWSILFLLMMVRDQFNCLLVVRSKTKVLSYVTLASAITALLTIRIAVPLVGSVGAIAGIITGELLNMTGMAVLTYAELRRKD